MSSPHDQTDQLLDDIINHDLHLNTHVIDEDDAEILQGLVDLYQADPLSSSAKHRILAHAHANVSTNKQKRVLPLPHKERVGRLVAVFAVVASFIFMLNTVRVLQYNATLSQVTPTPLEMMLPTAIPSEVLFPTLVPTPTPMSLDTSRQTMMPVVMIETLVPTPTPMSANLLLGDLPQLSTAFEFEYGGYIASDTSDSIP